MAPDLDKLRRFALSVALVHLAFGAAGVRLEPAEIVKPLGIPLKILTPHLFGFVLVGASLYALLRYVSYGYLVEESPAAARRAVRELMREGREYKDGYRYATVRSVNEAEAWIRRVKKAIPGGDATTHQAAKSPGEGRDIPPAQIVRVRIPKSARYLARLLDFDYAAPVWANALAILMAAASLLRGG